MQVDVVAAEHSDRPVLASLLQLYLYDFTEFMGWDLPETGRFGDDDLDGCWTDPARHPYLIRADGKLAGFAIIDRRSGIDGDPEVNDVGEFFIVRRWRRRGVGSAAARRLFDLYPGRWEVRELLPNVEGQAFWRRVIGRYTGGRFEEREMDVHGRRSIVQSFSAPGVLDGS